MTAARVCKDCVTDGVTTVRPAPHQGPRCATHHRTVRRSRKAALHEKRVQDTYGLAPGDYQRLYAAQGGVCAICGPWSGRNGASRRLSVDHNHATGEVRGLLCRPCNTLVGQFRDNPAVFARGADYLTTPPARKVLG